VQKLNLTNFAMSAFDNMIKCHHQTQHQASYCTSAFLNETKQLSSNSAEHQISQQSSSSSDNDLDLASQLTRFSHYFTANEAVDNKRSQQLLLTSINNEYLVNYTADLYKLLSVCHQMESNVVYLEWLFNIFKPLLTTLFLTLFLLPSVIVVGLYASSMFLFLTKNWNKLKVSLSHLQIIKLD
jgi:hypothetical protein